MFQIKKYINLGVTMLRIKTWSALQRLAVLSTFSSNPLFDTQISDSHEKQKTVYIFQASAFFP